MSCATRYRSIVAAAAALLMPLLAGAAERLIIDHVTVIAGTGSAPQSDMAVIVDGERIAAVTPSQLAGSAAWSALSRASLARPLVGGLVCVGRRWELGRDG